MPSTRPNILWYCTDQQRFDTIAALGNPRVRTPALDRLAGEGVAFTTAYCQSPICTPSRASFLGGLAHRLFARHLTGGPIPPGELEAVCREVGLSDEAKEKVSENLKAEVDEAKEFFDRKFATINGKTYGSIM